MEFTQNEVIEKRHGIFDYKNVFITGNYFIFLKNNEITLYNQLIKGKKITVKLDCTPQKIIDVRGIIYILCETSVIELKPPKEIKKKFDTNERYKDIMLFNGCESKNLFALASLWGVTIVNEIGETIFFRTFGDLIITPKHCTINNKKGLLVGSRNGWFYHIDCRGNTTIEFNTEAGITAFNVLEKNTITKIFYANTEGEIKELVLTPRKHEKTITKINDTVYRLDIITNGEINLVTTTTKEIMVIETQN